jgi:hypothetical protein
VATALLSNQQHYVVLSPATHCDFLFQAIRAILANAEALPTKDEVSKIRSDEDANDEVPIVVHGEKHDKVGDGKLTHVKERTDGLLKEVWAEFLSLSRSGGVRFSRGSGVLAWAIMIGRGGRGWRRSERTGVLSDDVTVVLFAGAAKELEKDYEKDDADAAAGKHTLGRDVP